MPPLAAGELPGPGIDIVELRGDDAGPAARLGPPRADRGAAPSTGLGDVSGRLRDPLRDPGGGLRAVPYLWSPQLLLARRSVFGSGRRRRCARSSRSAVPRAPRCPTRRSSSRSPRATSASATRSRSIATSWHRRARCSRRRARSCASTAMPPSCARSSGAGDRPALGTAGTLGDQRGAVVATLPSQGTIATSARSASSRHAARRLRAPRRRRAARRRSAQARLAAAHGGSSRCARRPARCSRRSPARRCGARSRARSRTAPWPFIQWPRRR